MRRCMWKCLCEMRRSGQTCSMSRLLGSSQGETRKEEQVVMQEVVLFLCLCLRLPQSTAANVTLEQLVCLMSQNFL